MGKRQILTMEDVEAGANVGVFDIESGSLNAEYGRFLSMAVCDLKATRKSQVKVLRVDETDHNGRPGRDKHITRLAVKELNKWDYLVSYNGKWFDVPMITSYALRNLVQPLNTEIKHVDLYQLNRKRFRFGGRSLHMLLSSLHTKITKYHVPAEDWRYATAGDTQALNRIVVHNIYDVLSLAELTRDILKLMPINWTYIR